MKFLKLIPIMFIFFGNLPYKNYVHAETKNPKEFKVLSNDNKKLSISNVEYYIKQGDQFIKNGDFDKAKESYLNARKLAKQLASFYSDLNTAFIGIDARIPSEVQRKGKETLKILAETNTFLFCRINKKEHWTYVGKLDALNFETSTDPIKFQFEVLDYQDNASGALKDIYDWKPNNQTVVPRLSSNLKKVRRTSQGYISDTKKKNAIELHAMEQAYKFYSDQDFEVIDVSDTKGLGYDYKCIKDEIILEVEVKGRSSSGKEVNLTRNEVINAQTTNNVPVLFIVFDILLVIDGKDYKVINSKQKVINNWKPQEKNLEALTYKYSVES